MTLDRQPHLTGDLIEVRPLRTDDWDALFAVASDPLLWEQHPDSLRYTEPVFRDTFRGNMESGGALAILDRATGGIIGSSRYALVEGDPEAVEIGWTFLACAYWGGRYNGELKRLMLDHAFRSVKRVVFCVGENNLRSRRAVERLGAVVRRTKEVHFRGVPHPHVEYVLERH